MNGGGQEQEQGNSFETIESHRLSVSGNEKHKAYLCYIHFTFMI
jgi:hypothetical protein